MLRHVIDDKLLQCRGVIGFWAAHSVDDDIIVYEKTDGDVAGVFHGLRQQVI